MSNQNPIINNAIQANMNAMRDMLGRILYILYIMRNSIIVIICFVAISGCTTTANRVVYKYINPNISEQNKESQTLIDKGECLQKSYVIPLPEAPNLANIGGGYSGGYARGALIGQYKNDMSQAKADRRLIFDGCMLEKGYQKIIVGNDE